MRQIFNNLIYKLVFDPIFNLKLLTYFSCMILKSLSKAWLFHCLTRDCFTCCTAHTSLSMSALQLLSVPGDCTAWGKPISDRGSDIVDCNHNHYHKIISFTLSVVYNILYLYLSPLTVYIFVSVSPCPSSNLQNWIMQLSVFPANGI